MTILAAIVFSFYFVEVARIQAVLRLPIKPFGCMVCLTAYVAAGLYWCPAWVVEYVAIVFGTPLLGVLFRNLFINLNPHT
jgi:hypothetical protein